MMELFLQLVAECPHLVTAVLVTCPLLAMAILAWADVAKLEMWKH